MTNTQDDCRRAFEKWYNDFPVGGRAAKEGLAWTVWQAAWSTRPSAAGDVVVRRYQSIADIPKQVLAAIESDCEIVDKVANALKASVCHLGMLEDAYILANIALDIIKQAAIAAMHPAPLNVDELVETISKEADENPLADDYWCGRMVGLRRAIALIRKWAEGKL